MSLPSVSLRARTGAVLFAILLAGCPTGSDGDAPGSDGTDEAGTDGGPGPGNDASTGPQCGPLTTLCKDGEKCTTASDCTSKICFGGTCQTPAPADGTKNGDENRRRLRRLEVSRVRRRQGLPRDERLHERRLRRRNLQGSLADGRRAQRRRDRHRLRRSEGTEVPRRSGLLDGCRLQSVEMQSGPEEVPDRLGTRRLQERR